MNFLFNVTYRDSIPGSAAADIEIEFPQGILATLYWADKDGKPLENYLPIKSLPMIDGKASYSMIEGWMIPEEAEMMLVKVYNDAMVEIVLPEMKAMIPEEKRLAKAEPKAKVFVTSDVHIGGDYFHNRENREKAFRTIAEYKPDFVLISGDASNNAEVREYALATEMLLTAFSDLPIGICPGNHDYTPYNPGAVAHPAEMHEFFCKIAEHNRALGVECTEPTEGDNNYAMTVGGVKSIMVNAHLPHAEYGEGNRAFLDEQLSSCDGARYRFVVNHYHMQNTVANIGKQKGGKYFRDNDEVQAILDKHENIIHVSGHTHFTYDSDCLNSCFDPKHKNVYLNAGCAVWNGCQMEVRREYYLQHRATGQIVEIYDGYIITRGIDFVCGKFYPRCLMKAEI